MLRTLSLLLRTLPRALFSSPLLQRFFCITAFAFLNSFQLSDIKSPTDKKTTLLHYLVELISTENPTLLSFAENLYEIFHRSCGGMHSFHVVCQYLSPAFAHLLTFFPDILTTAWTVEREYHFCPPTDGAFREALLV